MKLKKKECHFSVRQLEFLSKTIWPKRIGTQTHKIQNCLTKQGIPKSKKAAQLYPGFDDIYRRYIPRMDGKLNPFYNLLTSDTLSNITSEPRETFDSVKKLLSYACEIAIKQPLQAKHISPKARCKLQNRWLIYSCLTRPQTKKSSQSGKRTPRAVRIKNPKSKCQYTRKSFWQSE